MTALGEHGDLPSLEVARVDGAFFPAGEDGDHTTEGAGLLEEGQEVDDESIARIGYQRGRIVEAFWSLCVRAYYGQPLSFTFADSSLERTRTMLEDSRTYPSRQAAFPY